MGKIKYFIFSLSNYLTDKILFQNNNSSNVLGYYSMWINEINDSNVLRDRWEKLVIFCCEVCVLYMKWYSAIGKEIYISCKLFYKLSSNH